MVNPTTQVTIAQAPSALLVDASSVTMTPVSCFGGSDGGAVVATGGLPPYTYSWALQGNPLANTTNSISSVSVGTYTCFVTDQAGCTESVTFDITEPNSLQVVLFLHNQHLETMVLQLQYHLVGCLHILINGMMY